MEQIASQLVNMLELPYLFSVIFLAYIILYKVIPNPCKRTKFIVSLCSGAALGVIWYLFIEVQISKLIVSYLVSVAFYQYIKEAVLKRLNIDYERKKK